MGLETATYVADLVTTNPVAGDTKSQGDDHLRLIKAALQATFPGADVPFFLSTDRTDVASASTCDIGAVTSQYVNITGTTTITAFGTANAGVWRWIRFNAALTLTHNGTSLILPNGVNITTVAGDHALAFSRGSGNWTVLFYQRGVPLAREIGEVVDFAGATAPTGWLLCFGQAVSRSTYAALFAVISTTYGVGDGSTTFNLPDCRGRVVAGQDDMGGTSANRLTLDLNGDTLGASGGTETDSHNHGGVTGAGGGNQDVENGTNQEAAQRNHTHSIASDTTSTVQPTIIMNKMIYTGVL